MKKLIVVVPAYNESEGITKTVSSIKSVTNEINEIGFQLLIYIVDDGSNDQTADLALKAGADRIIRHKINRGLGAAVRSGMAAARADEADIVVKFDADLQHDPHDIKKLIAPIINDEADIVYGHRFDNITYKMPCVRRWGNRTFVFLMRLLTGWPITDSQPGIFAADKAYLKIFRIPGDYNYTQQILLDAYHKGMRFAQEDVIFHERKTGKSFISFKYPFKVLPQIFWVIVGLKPMKIFGSIGAIFLFIGLAISGFEISHWFMEQTNKPIQHVNLVLGLILFGLHMLSTGIIAELIVRNKGTE